MEIMSSSFFDSGPILAKKCYFCHFLQFLHAQYSIDRYINDRYDLTNVLEQENFFNFLKKNTEGFCRNKVTVNVFRRPPLQKFVF